MKGMVLLLYCSRDNVVYMEHFIKKLQAKPVHIRERIAFGTALGISGLLLIAWAVSSFTTGILGPKQSASAFFNESQKAAITTATNPKPKPQGFFSAAASALGGQKPQAPAHLEIVTIGSTSTVPTTSTERTTIPF